MTGETKAFTSQCKLREGHDGIRNYDMHRIVCHASILDTNVLFQRFIYLASLFYQLDTTLKVMYQHEIICTGNTVQFNLKLFVCTQCTVTASLWKICE